MPNNSDVILCVDDEIIVLAVLKETLLNEFENQYIIETAESAEEGLEVIEEMQADGYNFAMIISDWMMPEMNGDEFLIKTHQILPDTPKILLSGQIDYEALEKTREEAQLHEILYKPWKRDVFMNSVNSGLKKYYQKTDS